MSWTTVADASRNVGVPERTIRNWITAGRLPVRKRSGVQIIPAEDAEILADIWRSGARLPISRMSACLVRK